VSGLNGNQLECVDREAWGFFALLLNPPFPSGRNLQRAVIIAMPCVIMMHVAGDEVIEMITVGDALVSACRAVEVRSVVAAATMIRSARGRICLVYADRMFIHVSGMQMMQMAIVKVVGMIFMNHCRMATL